MLTLAICVALSANGDNSKKWEEALLVFFLQMCMPVTQDVLNIS